MDVIHGVYTRCQRQPAKTYPTRKMVRITSTKSAKVILEVAQIKSISRANRALNQLDGILHYNAHADQAPVSMTTVLSMDCES
jgi:hypothetical protein